MSRTQHTCCGVVDEVRTRRTQDRPQPWIVRKFTVALTILIIGDASYVYAARFCRDMITQSPNALGNQATGVAFLVVFALLLFLTSWSYFMVITTPPGDARLYTQRTTKPGYDHNDGNSSDVHGASYELTPPTHPLPTHESAKNHYPRSSLGSGKSKTSPSATASSVVKLEHHSHSRLEEGSVTDALPHPTLPDSRQAGPSGPPMPMFSRRPTTTPVLSPEYRYCSRCQIVKPHRAHHCRACGTCVLKYDHHCPWIGQCVGAFNQKFFVNFLQWGTVFCLWTFATLLGLNVKPHALAVAVDPQQIVIIALAGFFGIFSTLIFIVQLYLILLNQTTVESLTMRAMRDREQEMISQMHRWYDVCAKRRTRHEWDSEWGRIGLEGNLWWLGNYRENWLAVMGTNKWRWFLPIAGTLGDGLSYPTNPRFDSAGRWRRRKEWPSHLQ